MNTELIKKTSRTKYLHSLAKIANKENHEALLLVTLGGGTFRSNPELIAFLSVESLGDTVILLDIYENPVKIDRLKLLDSCILAYKSTMISWLNSSEQINGQR